MSVSVVWRRQLESIRGNRAYLIEGTICIALGGVHRAGGARGEGFASRSAEREELSLKYLEQIARPMVSAGLLASVRGKGGGYRLARDPQ